MSYQTIDATTEKPSEIYRRIISLVIPRPIAWVSTLGPEGIVNLAPFSFFNAVSSNPPCLVVSVTRNPDGSKKDTLRNIETHREFVVNVSHDWMMEKVNDTSAPLPHGESEVTAYGLHTIPSESIRVPRIKESLAHFECVLEHLYPVGGDDLGSAMLVVGRVVRIHTDESVLNDRGLADPEKLRPLARLGGISYSKLGEISSVERPKGKGPSR